MDNGIGDVAVMREVMANLGFMLQIAGILMIAPIIVGSVLNETSMLIAVFITCVSFLICGFILNSMCEKRILDVASSCILIVAAFVIMPLIGAAPYFYLDPFSSPDIVSRLTNSIFESVSGFTTTGFSLITSGVPLPRSFVLYRSMTEMMGGVGLVFMLLTFFQTKKTTKLFGSALGIDDVCGDIRRTFFSILGIYSIYVALVAIIFALQGFDVVTAVSFSIDVLTGGFQPEQPVGQFSLIVKSAIIVLLFLGSVNFGFNYRLFTRKYREAFDGEVKAYIGVLIVGALAIGLLTGAGAFDSVFHALSMSASAGFDYLNIGLLGDPAKTAMLILVLIGGCSFSMAGGIRIFRLMDAYQAIRKTINIYRRRSFDLKWDHAPDQRKLFESLVSIVMFVAILVIISTLAQLAGLPYLESYFEIGSALTTNGVTTGATGPTSSISQKWLMIAAMTIGRVEIITILIALASANAIRTRLEGLRHMILVTADYMRRHAKKEENWTEAP